MAKAPAAKTVTVTQYASPQRRPADQRATLIGLGLNKMNRRSTLALTRRLAFAATTRSLAKSGSKTTAYAFANFAGTRVVGNFIELHCRIP